MNNESRALVQAITGPVILITVGSLFALDKSFGYSFHQTWPVLIIVIGCLKLFGGGGRGLFRSGCATSRKRANAAAQQPYTPPPTGAQPNYQPPNPWQPEAGPSYDPRGYNPSAPPPPPQPGVRQ